MKFPQHSGKQLISDPTMRERVLSYVVSRRWQIVLGMALITVSLVIIEHFLLTRFGEFAHLVFDIVLIAVLPLAAWSILGLLGTAAAGRDRAAQAGYEFNQKIGEAATWDDLVTQLVQYPHQVAPQAEVTLYIHHPDAARLEPEARCARDGMVTLRPKLPISPDSLPVGSLPQLLLQRPGQAPVESPTLPPHRYDLPITRNDHTLAVLKLEYPPRCAPGPEELRALQAAAPVMGMALEVALLQNLSAEQAAATTAARQRIAQTLHDTLAQNVGYLRLKLDQLTGENAIREIGVVLQELERMRAAADEAYAQVRQTLDELNPLPSGDLASLLTPQAEAICHRAGLELVTHQSGTPYPLSPQSRQQILYVVREALYNVEKHARARQVTLTILWQPTELIVKISDDGVGFDPRAVEAEPNGHYGLWIMQRRAAEIGGMLQVSAEAGSGSEVTFWLPRPAPVATVEPSPVESEIR